MNVSIMDRLAKHQASHPVNIEGAIRDLGIALNRDALLPPDIAGHVRRLADGRIRDRLDARGSLFSPEVYDGA